MHQSYGQVTELASLTSREVGQLSAGVRVEVIETQMVGDRIRGSILKPVRGWISLHSEKEQRRLACNIEYTEEVPKLVRDWSSTANAPSAAVDKPFFEAKTLLRECDFFAINVDPTRPVGIEFGCDFFFFFRFFVPPPPPCSEDTPAVLQLSSPDCQVSMHHLLCLNEYLTRVAGRRRSKACSWGGS